MQARILAAVCRTHGSAPGSARTVRPAPRSHCHASCVSVANSWRSDGAPARAQDPRYARRQLARFDQPRVHAVHADRSRLVRGVPGEPDASLAEAPRQAALEQAERRPVNLRRPRRAPGSPRGDQLLEPLHRCRVFRGVLDLESPAASPLLEGPVDARQVWIENDAHFGGKLPRRLDLVDGEDLARAMLRPSRCRPSAARPSRTRRRRSHRPVGSSRFARRPTRFARRGSRSRPGRASPPPPGGSRRPRRGTGAGVPRGP